LQWGMMDFVKTEYPRQAFWGDTLPSLETGRLEMYFPESERRCRVMVSLFVICVLMAIVTGAVVSVYIVQHFAEEAGGFWEQNAGIIAGGLSAIQIQVMNLLYRSLAICINDFENHRTDSEYEDSLVLKIFLFQIVNSYSSLGYIAFIKSSDQCLGSCMNELQTSLAAIFVIGLFLDNFFEVGIPRIVNCLQGIKGCSCCSKKREEDEHHHDPQTRELLHIEKQFFVLDNYDIVLGQLDDYAELAIQFGYVTLFVVCFPLAPLLALVTCWIEIRTDSYKLIEVFRRPTPAGAQSIGPWESVFVNMSRLSVVSNAAILCYTSDYLKDTYDLTSVQSQQVFIAYVALMLILLWIIDVAIPDVPTAVQIQYNRQTYLVKKVIDRVADEHDFLKKAEQESKHLRPPEPRESRPKIINRRMRRISSLKKMDSDFFNSKNSNSKQAEVDKKRRDTVKDALK